MTRYLPFLCAFFVLLFAVAPVPGAGKKLANSPKPKVSASIVEQGAPMPDDCEKIRLFPDGVLRDIDSHKIDDKTLKAILRQGGAKSGFHIILIKVENGDRTPVSVLKRLLNRILAYADPNRETKVYVYLGKSSSN
jgi:hypothetical protein